LAFPRIFESGGTLAEGIILSATMIDCTAEVHDELPLPPPY
jgi:hypothetical protein